jgi:hypothetical protein
MAIGRLDRPLIPTASSIELKVDVAMLVRGSDTDPIRGLDMAVIESMRQANQVASKAVAT